MAKKIKTATHENPALAQGMLELRRSGAAGVHADQKARRHRAGATNRIGSRSSRTRQAIRMEFA